MSEEELQELEKGCDHWTTPAHVRESVRLLCDEIRRLGAEKRCDAAQHEVYSALCNEVAKLRAENTQLLQENKLLAGGDE